jgi:hypothetical protein
MDGNVNESQEKLTPMSLRVEASEQYWTIRPAGEERDRPTGEQAAGRRRRQVQEVRSGSTLLPQSDLRLHFGFVQKVKMFQGFVVVLYVFPIGFAAYNDGDEGFRF